MRFATTLILLLCCLPWAPHAQVCTSTTLPLARPAPLSNLPMPLQAPLSSVTPRGAPSGGPTRAVGRTYLSANQCFISRASTGTYIDASGVAQTAAVNTARPDYHPTTHTYLGILAEEARTNWIGNSQATSSWAGYYVKPPITGTTDPQGYTAFRLATPDVGGSANGETSGFQINNASAPTTGDFVLSFRARFARLTSSHIAVSTGDSQTHSTYTLLRDGTVVTSGGTGAVLMQSFIPDTNWHDWEVRFTNVNRPAGGGCCSTRVFQFFEVDPSPLDIDISRLQVEIGSTATSYIPTNGSVVTRAADIYQ